MRYANIAYKMSSIIMTQEECKHEIRYEGVVNLLHGFGIAGAVDVWKCANCGQIWCEEKRLGVIDLQPNVGFPANKAGAEWVILICKEGEGLEWHLLQVEPEVAFEHNCQLFNTVCRISIVKGQAICDIHKQGHEVYLVKENINKSLRV